MIAWTNPAALWALLLVAGPVIVHLLRRHRAARVPFPSLRFVRPAETSAVRLRLPSDPWLLLLRMAAIALAACAAAGPILLTGARLSRWDALTARAIVVDTSGSMSVADADGAVPARLADDAAQAESTAAAYSQRVEASSLGEGIRRAVAWIASAPPARREVVVITDAERGAVDAGALRLIPDAVGVRVVAVGRRPREQAFDGAGVLVDADGSRRQHVALTVDTTAVAVGDDARIAGVRIVTGGDDARSTTARVLEVAGRAGSAAPSPDQPIAFRFRDAVGAVPRVVMLTNPWMLSTVVGVIDDRILASIDSTGVTPLAGEFSRSPWTTVLARDGAPLVSASALDDELVVQAGAPWDSVFAAAVVRSVLNARARATSYVEREIATTAPATLAAWQRAAAPVDRAAWRQARTTDARWCWMLALAALGTEQWLRARSRRRRAEEFRVAA